MPMGCQLFSILLVKAQDNRSTFKNSSQDMNRDSGSYDTIENIVDHQTFIER